MPELSKGFESLALALQEASALMHGDVSKRLSSAVDDAHKASGSYAYYVDHSGSGKSGHVIYRKNGDTMKAPYSLSDTESGAAAKVHIKDEKKVIPTVTYACPDEDDAKEALAIEVTGDTIPLKEGAVGQDGTVLLKVIAPGWGSSGYYPADVLERDLPKIYPAGTKQFWDHATDAEESARPEGSLRNLASVSLEAVKYMKDGPDGPGGYAKVKAAQEFRQPIDDLAKHIGVSIRASGTAKQGKAPDGKTGNIIERLTRGHSFDYVTTAGAGGKVLQLFEAARQNAEFRETTPQGENEVDATEAKALRESVALATSENKKLRERFALIDAREAIAQFFTTVRVGEAIEGRVAARLLERTVPVNATGDLDKEALQKLWEAETKDEAAYVNKLAGGRVVVAMGTTTVEPTAEQRETERKREDKHMDVSARQYGFRTKEGAAIFNRGRGEFDPTFNARELGHEPVGAEV